MVTLCDVVAIGQRGGLCLALSSDAHHFTSSDRIAAVSCNPVKLGKSTPAPETISANSACKKAGYPEFGPHRVHTC
jgi:hypothetical protein